MAKLELELNEAKTSFKDARHESFDFLGYTRNPPFSRTGDVWYLGAAPSEPPKKCAADQESIGRSAIC